MGEGICALSTALGQRCRHMYWANSMYEVDETVKGKG